MATVYIITRLTIHEAYRRKILWAALALGVLFLVIFGLGFYFIQKEVEINPMNTIARSQMYNFLLMAGLYVVNFLTIAMSVLTSVDTLAGEISSGTIQTLVTKPIRRWEVVMGKWLGYVAMLSLYLLLMAGGTLGIVYFVTGYSVPNVGVGVALLWLNAILLLSVSFLGGAYLSTLANGVMAFGMFGVAFVGGWIEQIGSFVGNRFAVNIGVISSLIIPSEALWKRAAHEMESPLVSAMGISVFSSGSVPSPAMVVYAVLYVVVVLALAVRKFSQRDM
jgi:ABC-type transport system involved in multi-copper enzyme maturation permease subunit